MLIEVTIRAWGRTPFSSVSEPSPVISTPGLIEVDEDDKVDLKRLTTALCKLKLLHDVEPNPGPFFSTRLPDLDTNYSIVEKY